jgi:8-oxo-dGTP pyrophosphatase MutT (NUDIX family)
MAWPSALEDIWPSIEIATRRGRPRVPFVIDEAVVGSVAVAHLDALRPWAPSLRVTHDTVVLTVPVDARDEAFAAINAALREQGLIRAWRDETYPVVDPATRRRLARFERAASRFWGTLTFGAHATGWVAGADGHPAALWIAQRSLAKATDPGAHDNLVGGGVPHGQTAFETLVREGWEEAGLRPEVMHRARRGRVIRLQRDIPEGLQFEWIHAFDLHLQPDEIPVNQDGEVHAFTLHPMADALAIAAGTTMTADAALVTLDFALRHRLLPPAEHEVVAARAAGLWVTTAVNDCVAP